MDIVEKFLLEYTGYGYPKCKGNFNAGLCNSDKCNCVESCKAYTKYVKMKKCIEFYADQENWEPQPLHPLNPNSWKCAVEVDGGNMAKQTLKEE